MPATPVETLIDRSGLRCTVCGSPRSVGCGCWTKCRCGWSFRTGSACRNPDHAMEADTAGTAAAVVAKVLREVARRHPEPMRAASGGFRRTLKARAVTALASGLCTVGPGGDGDLRLPRLADGVVLDVAALYPAALKGDAAAFASDLLDALRLAFAAAARG